MAVRGETRHESAPLGLHSAAQGHVGCRPHPSRRCRARRGPKATRTRDCRSLWAASQDVAAKPERPSRRAGSFGKDRNRIDRKSVVWGKRVSVRVELGGRRHIKKKKKKKK